MIDFNLEQIVMAGNKDNIERWEVWFQTPFGITPVLSEACERCQQADLDAEVFVSPVPVAIGKSGKYEIAFPRR